MEDEKLYKKLQTIDSDEEKMKIIEQIKTPYLKESAIFFLKEDINKLTMAETLRLEMQKARVYMQVIENVELEDRVIDRLEKIRNKRTAAEIIKKVGNFKKRVNGLVGLLYNGNCDDISREIITESILKDITREPLFDSEFSIDKFIDILDSDKSKAVAINEFIKDDDKAKDAIKKIQSVELREKMNLQHKNKEELMEVFGNNSKKLIIPKDMTIGVELEAEGDDAAIFYGRTLLERWAAIADNSLQNGVEIVSPILRNSTEEMEELYLVTKVMKSSRVSGKR